MEQLIVAVDFDGTCVTHDFPRVGQDVDHCVGVLRRLREHNVRIILYTMRCESVLAAAVQWFVERGIDLFAINCNPEQDFSTSPKVYAHYYIDDAAIGCPLINDPSLSPRPFVDWRKVEEILFGKQHFIEPIHRFNLN